MKTERQLHTENNSHAFRDFFVAEYPEMLRIAIRYIKDRDTASDLVHDAFLSLWEKWDALEPGRPVKPYLITSVKNKCLNYLRDQKKFFPGLIDLEEATLAEGHASHLTESKEIQRRIDETIKSLPPKCREVYELNRIHHLRYQQIADRLDISLKTVEAQMSKALKTLRDHLREIGRAHV